MRNLALVLTAKPGSSAFEDAHVSEIWSRLPSHGVDRAWLAPAGAWQATFLAERAGEADAVRALAREVLAGLPVDVNIVPDDVDRRRKRLLVADMESTIIGEECLDEIAGYAGLRPRISAITLRAMKGEVAFEAALRERVTLLEGLDASVLDDVYARVTTTSGAETLVKTMKHHGARCALVSGGFTFFTERIARRLGFDTHQANTLEIRDGKLTGCIVEPILGREAKLAALKSLASESGLDMDETMAVGDGANDLGMIRSAGLGVAFRAKAILADQAAASIVHGDLTALLFLQGYRREEFVA